MDKNNSNDSDSQFNNEDIISKKSGPRPRLIARERPILFASAVSTSPNQINENALQDQTSTGNSSVKRRRLFARP